MFLFAQQGCREYENAWLGTIFGCKREVIEQWIQFHSEGLHNVENKIVPMHAMKTLGGVEV